MVVTFLTVVGAVSLDIFFGDPPNRFHPVALMGKYIGSVYRLRPEEGEVGKFLFGALLTISGLVVFTLPWIVINGFSIPLMWLWNMLFLKIVLSINGLVTSAMEIRNTLLNGETERAKEYLDQAIDMFQQMGNTWDLEKAEQTLKEF